MSILARTFQPDGSSRLDDPAEISDVIAHRESLVWVDVLDATGDDFETLIEEFGLHPMAVEDARKHGQRPKLEHYPNHSFLVLYSREMAEVDLFVGSNWLVTVRERNPDGEHCRIEGIRTRFERHRPEDTTVGYLVYTVLDELVDGYLAHASEVEERVEDLEERVLTDQPDPKNELQTELLALRRQLVQFRRRVVPLREVVARLHEGEVESIDAEARIHLQDVVDHVLRAVDHLDAERELIASVSDAQQALLSNRINQVMKRMTSWGALLLGSTLIAGIYGMNFQHMPELGWKLGYLWALGLMVVTTTVGFTYFRKKDWL